jgi:hypothetical protein
MITFNPAVVRQQWRFNETASYTAEDLRFDPLLGLAWVLRSR